MKDELVREFKKAEAVLSADEEEELSKRSRFFRFLLFLRKHMHVIASAIVGTIYIGCEAYALFQLKAELQQTTTSV